MWHRAVAPLGIALVAALLGLGSAAAGSPAAPPADDSGPWQRLGPLGPVPISALAISPAWPDDRLLLAARGDDLARSPDGGATWERLPAPAPHVTRLVLAAGSADTPVAFALADGGLSRSTDLGASWQAVLPAGGELSLSPDFARDGLAFLAADDALYQSADGGATWAPTDPASGQHVQQVVFSPDFARDHTLFLAAVTGGFPDFLQDHPDDQAPDDHEQSLGVLVSRDGGQSWTPASDGLAVGGIPYRHVRRLALSPTYAQDGTLFAVAWGPRDPGPLMGGQARYWSGAIFRSQDRAATWAPSLTFDSTPWRHHLFLSLSPRFAADGLALLVDDSSLVSPAQAGCEVHRTTDHGATWATALSQYSYTGCGPLAPLLAADPTPAALVDFETNGGGGWMRSTDGGESWEPFPLPDGAHADLSASQLVVTADGTLLVGARADGIWAFGPSAQATGGRLPCPAEPGPDAAPAFASDPTLQQQLGCALEPPHPAHIQEWHQLFGGQTPQRLYWTDADPGSWYTLDDGATTLVHWTELPFGWPAQPDRTVDGSVQPFEAGTLLLVPQPDGSRHLLALLPILGQYRELTA